MVGQTSKVGGSRQGIHGTSCPFCGGQAYQVILRSTDAPNDPALLVRCHQCHHAKNLDQRFQETLWL